MDFYSVTAPAISRNGVPGIVVAYSSERDSEVNSALHDAYLMRAACKLKRARQTGVGVRQYVEKTEYVKGHGLAHWIKRASLPTTSKE